MVAIVISIVVTEIVEILLGIAVGSRLNLTASTRRITMQVTTRFSGELLLFSLHHPSREELSSSALTILASPNA